MNKAVHALVYVILAVAGVALYFEMNLFEKRELLQDSNKQLRDCIVELSKVIEAEDAPANAVKRVEVGIDKEPCEARELDEPQLTPLLEDYHPQYEVGDLPLMKWGGTQAEQLRKHYALEDGKKKPDNANPGKYLTTGKGTAQELIDVIVDRAKKQYANLQKTRNELANLRGKLTDLAEAYNKLPKEIRRNKVEIANKEKDIERLEDEKKNLEDQLQKAKAEVEEQKTEIKSLQEERDAAKDETEAVKEDLAKAKETVERLTNMLKTQSSAPRAAGGGAVAGGGQLTSGEKGKVSAVDNGRLYAVVKFEDAALDELIGAERNGALPPHEMLVVREDAQKKKRIVGKIRLRQWTPKTNFVKVDILQDWQQAPIEVGDVILPD